VIELLEGHPPYHHLDPMPALFRIVQDDCPPLPEGASPMVLDFLKHCFEKDPSLRISAETLLEHPWMSSARRQLKQMKSTGSIGKDVHDHAVRTVRDHNRSSGRKGECRKDQAAVRGLTRTDTLSDLSCAPLERSKPPPLRLDQAQLARSDLLSPGLSSSRSLRRVAGSIASGPSTPSSPVRKSPLRLEQRPDSLDCDAEPMAQGGASVDFVHREPVDAATPTVSATRRPSSVKGGRTTSSRQSTLHARDRDSAALSTGQQTDAYSDLGFTSTLSSRRAGSQASTSSSTRRSATTTPHKTTPKTSSRIAPHVLDAVGGSESNATVASPLSFPREGAAAQGKHTVDTRPADVRCEGGGSDSAWRNPSPQRIVFRSPFTVAGADSPVQIHSRRSREYVMPKDLSKVRRSVSLLKHKDAAGRTLLQASDLINQLSEPSTKTSVRAEHVAAAHEQQAVKSAKAADLANQVRNAPPPSTRLASDTIPTIPEQRVPRQSRYASGVKRSASLLSRTFSGSSSPTRPTPRPDNATRPRTDVASDESIEAADRSSGLNSSVSREVLIRVLKGWR
jgi:serine/threonine protein kinase